MNLAKSLCMLFLLFVLAANAQSTQENITEIKEKIRTIAQGEKLLWMDSLSKSVRFERDGLFDSIAN